MSDPFISETEELLLKRMHSVKEQIIKRIDPTTATTKEVELLLKTVESVENTVFKRTNLRAKKQDNDTTNNIQSIVAELLKQHKSTNNINVEKNIPSLPDNMVPTDIVDGETEMGIITIDYKEVIDDE